MPETKDTLDRMTAELFELYHLIAMERSRRPSGHDDLSEGEFLTLEILSREEPLTIGDVQKRIGVVPAQMSRIVRSLEEEGGKGYVSCRINPEDRRRVDLQMTQAGKKALQNFRDARMKSLQQILSILSVDDRLHFMRIMRLLRSQFDAYSTANQS